MTPPKMTEEQRSRPLPGHSAEAETDVLRFHGSPKATLGIEIEMPVLDREGFELAPGAPRILKACQEEDVPGFTSELMQSMLEVRTDICENVREAEHQLKDRLRRARTLADSFGYKLALFGTHPFHRINASAITNDPRYERVVNRLGWITYHRVAFGLHIHVGVSGGDRAIQLMNVLVQYVPHLLGLSANSPFWQGVDTGLNSSRAVLYGLVAHSGIPMHMEQWKDFRSYFNVMRDCEAIRTVKGIKWDIRPRPDLGTLEFRICDTPSTLAEVLSIAALTRSLVIQADRLLTEHPRATSSDPRREWITVENRYLTARHGLDAVYIATPSGKRRVLRQELDDRIKKILPVAEESGDDRYLKRLLPISDWSNGANKQRRIYRDAGGWQALAEAFARSLEEELRKKSPSPNGIRAATG
jgi:carboxylate-amine ligase